MEAGSAAERSLLQRLNVNTLEQNWSLVGVELLLKCYLKFLYISSESCCIGVYCIRVLSADKPRQTMALIKYDRP